MAAPSLRIGSIVLDCDDFERMAAFWTNALGYEPREPAADGWVVLRDPEGAGPNVSINRTGEGYLDPYRLHLDLYAERAEEEVARLVRLGARIDAPARPGRDYAVLRDPDGNRFCVVEKRRPT